MDHGPAPDAVCENVQDFELRTLVHIEHQEGNQTLKSLNAVFRPFGIKWGWCGCGAIVSVELRRAASAKTVAMARATAGKPDQSGEHSASVFN